MANWSRRWMPTPRSITREVRAGTTRPCQLGWFPHAVVDRGRDVDRGVLGEGVEQMQLGRGVAQRGLRGEVPAVRRATSNRRPGPSASCAAQAVFHHELPGARLHHHRQPGGLEGCVEIDLGRTRCRHLDGGLADHSVGAVGGELGGRVLPGRVHEEQGGAAVSRWLPHLRRSTRWTTTIGAAGGRNGEPSPAACRRGVPSKDSPSATTAAAVPASSSSREDLNRHLPVVGCRARRVGRVPAPAGRGPRSAPLRRGRPPPAALPPVDVRRPSERNDAATPCRQHQHDQRCTWTTWSTRAIAGVDHTSSAAPPPRRTAAASRAAGARRRCRRPRATSPRPRSRPGRSAVRVSSPVNLVPVPVPSTAGDASSACAAGPRSPRPRAARAR